MSTIEIAYYAARFAKVNVASVGRRELTTRVRTRLKTLRKEGVLISFHDRSPGRVEEGSWSLRLDEERKAA